MAIDRLKYLWEDPRHTLKSLQNEWIVAASHYKDILKCAKGAFRRLAERLQHLHGMCTTRSKMSLQHGLLSRKEHSDKALQGILGGEGRTLSRQAVEPQRSGAAPRASRIRRWTLFCLDTGLPSRWSLKFVETWRAFTLLRRCRLMNSLPRAHHQPLLAARLTQSNPRGGTALVEPRGLLRMIIAKTDDPVACGELNFVCERLEIALLPTRINVPF